MSHRCQPTNCVCVYAVGMHVLVGSGDLLGQHLSMLIIKPLSSASGVSRQPLIFFTEKIKTNRGENKSADYINNMMLVGKQR